LQQRTGVDQASKKLLILLTDGTQTASAGAEDPGDIAEELRQAGLPIIVIGIGADTDHAELDHMAGGAGSAVFASSFDELVGGKFIGKLLGKACDQGSVLKCKPGFTVAADKIACEEDCWQQISPGCVNAGNMIRYRGKTIDECKKLCLDNPACKAIEYGVAHGGTNKVYNAGDCQLNNKAVAKGCDGQLYNLDLYIPKKC